MIYNLKPIQTKYNGVVFRSRLEATWAAFFDLVEWEWDYEPDIQLDGWIPDFTIKGNKLILVEVKPLPEFLNKEKIEKAIKGTEFEVLVVFNRFYKTENWDPDSSFGTLLTRCGEDNDELCWTDASFCIDGFSTQGMDWTNRLTGYYGKDIWNEDMEFIEDMWKIAKNKTRWEPLKTRCD